MNRDEYLRKYKTSNRIFDMLAEYESTHVLGGCSDSDVFRITSGDDFWYLKIKPNDGFESYEYEAKVLKWLNAKIPVPKVIDVGIAGNYEYFITSEIKGIDCCELAEAKNADPVKIATILASGLQMVHCVPIKNCPFDQTIAAKLRDARKNIEADRVDETDFDEPRQEMTQHEIFAELRESIPAEDNLVLNHGDYCLPNVVVAGNEISGFIDLGRAGISDKWNDLAVASRSIAYNLGSEYEKVFFDAYVTGEIDYRKIEYYRMLDELF